MRVLALVLLLAACGAAGERPSPASPPLGFVPKPDGIGVPGSPMEVGFGRVEAGARVALAKLAGPETQEQPCFGGGARVSYREGLSAIYLGGRFVGWETASARAGAVCH